MKAFRTGIATAHDGGLNFAWVGAPGEDRTRGLLIRSETLYPLSYWRMLLGE